MTKTETASEALARIEKRFFKGAGLKKACLKKGEERREYVLAQTERLLNDVQGLSHYIPIPPLSILYYVLYSAS